MLLVPVGSGVARGQSEWVRYGQSGLLKYQQDSRGDRLLDFSSAGYRGGATPPNPVDVVDAARVVALSPVAGDNRSRIQAAIDQVSGFSLNPQGFRGVVHLGAGQYDVSGTLTVEASGVIVRGVGDGASASANTVIRSTSTDPIEVFVVDSPNHNFHNLVASGPRVAIADKVVPAGATSLRVVDAQAFSVGDPVNVYRDSSQAWADSLDPPAGAGSWDTSEKRFDHQQERVVTRIEGDRLFLDAPIAHNIDRREGGGFVFRYGDNRVENVGFENLRGTTIFDASETQTVQGRPQFVDEDHAADFIVFRRAKNSWARGITGQHFSSSTVTVGSVSRSITITDAHSVEPVSLVTGGRRYSFNFNGGQFLLAQHLTSEEGRHSFVNNSVFNGFNRGPNVFYDAVSTDSFGETGPHQKYSTGTLYDNVQDDFEITARYSSSTGPNHGWTGANHVFWNVTAGAFQVYNPPGARNFLIGGVGRVDGGPQNRSGSYDSLSRRVTFDDPENPLDSLYVAQRLEKQRFPDLVRRDYVVGDFDELEDDGPASEDAVPVDPGWLAQIENLVVDRQPSAAHSGAPTTRFDLDATGHKVPFSIAFSLGEDEQVYAATLNLATKRFGPQSDDGLLWIDSPNNPLRFDTTAAWGPTYDGDLQVLSLEFVGDLGFLQDGLLNAVLAADRAVDWAQLELTVGPRTTPPGDHNGDGAVDAADYVLWRDTLGSVSDLRADSDRSGKVDAGDYLTWTANYGATANPAAAKAPEPSGCVVLGGAAIGFGTLRTRFSSN